MPGVRDAPWSLEGRKAALAHDGSSPRGGSPGGALSGWPHRIEERLGVRGAAARGGRTIGGASSGAHQVNPLAPARRDAAALASRLIVAHDRPPSPAVWFWGLGRQPAARQSPACPPPRPPRCMRARDPSAHTRSRGSQLCMHAVQPSKCAAGSGQVNLHAAVQGRPAACVARRRQQMKETKCAGSGLGARAASEERGRRGAATASPGWGVVQGERRAALNSQVGRSG